MQISEAGHRGGGLTGLRAKAELLLLVLAALLVPCGSGNAAVPGPRTGYDTFQKLTDFVFETRVPVPGMSRALLYRDNRYPFRTLAQINQYNVRSADLLEGTGQMLTLRVLPLESPYWWSVQDSAADARAFIAGLVELLQRELAAPERNARRHWPTVLHKALAQRDLFQIYCLVFRAAQVAEDEESNQWAQRLERLIARMFDSAVLSEVEYDELRSSLPKQMPAGFTAEPSFELSGNYLPRRVLFEDETWTRVPAMGKPFRHFRDYGGRSFIRVYVRSPQQTQEQLIGLWRRLFETYGANLHINAVAEEMPVRLETMLVRSFGVFVAGGDFRDSFWPEEIIIRMFKYPVPRLDRDSSDFRGTIFFQYKMSRAALLAQPASLGLRRVRDDDVQFYGFFGDVPDRHNSYSGAVTTMRGNCISCHSELFYGLNTIFSFERNPTPAAATRDPTGQATDGSEASYTLNTEEYKSLRAWRQARR